MKTSLRLSLCSVLGLALNLGAADKVAIESHFTSYHAAGKAIVEASLTRKVDATELDKKVQTMVADAVWFAGEYAKAFPTGQKLLKAVTDSVEAMKKLSFKDLEHEWHDMHHFEAADKDIGLDLKSEDNEHFTDPIHTIVHPLLALKAAQDYSSSKSADALKSMKEEMEEGLEQIEKMKNVLLKK